MSSLAAVWLHVVVERNICINTCIKILRGLLGIQTMFAGSNPEIEEDRAYIYIYIYRVGIGVVCAAHS